MQEQKPLATSWADGFMNLDENAYDPALKVYAIYPICRRRCLSLRAKAAQFLRLSAGERLWPDQALASVLHACSAASQEMEHEQDQANNQGNVNESRGYMECEKSEQPKNNQNCGDYPKHVFISFSLSAGTSAIPFSRTARMLFRVPEKQSTVITLAT
jgi:hypothetical protein